MDSDDTTRNSSEQHDDDGLHDQQGSAALSDRLGDAVAGLSPTPDLDGVIAGADRRRRRSRSVALGGAAAVVALGVGGVVMVASRDTADELPAAQPEPVVVPATTLAPGGDPDGGDADDGDPDGGTGDTQSGTVPVEDATDEPVATDHAPVPTIRLDQAPVVANGVDPADEYLDQTDEIYRRQLPSGVDFEIRQSRQSYGELFDIEWNLPTGSQSECLGQPAIFTGAPDEAPQWMSSWTVQQWWPISGEQDLEVTESYLLDRSVLIIRTDVDSVSAALVAGDQIVDEADFVDGLVAIEMPSYDSELGRQVFSGDGPMLSIASTDSDGSTDVETMAIYGTAYGLREIPNGCLAPPYPGSVLPEPGAEQPMDAATAEQSIRERHAVLVDRSLGPDDRPADILTDDTGVADARAQMESGAYADSASQAEYTIDELVFTDAETAWFEYTIDAPTGTFGGRFGEAIFNGEVWQITRQTICQDLSLAGGQCDPGRGTEAVRPPLSDGVDVVTAEREWNQLNQQYGNRLYCNPLNPCGDLDLAGQLPEAGDQPVDADAARADVIELMETLYGDGALLDRLDHIDDPSGIAEAWDQLAESAFGETAGTTEIVVDDVVFVAPDSAAFRYSLTTDTYSFSPRVGYASEIDGEWLITRNTVCSDLSLAGAICPDW